MTKKTQMPPEAESYDAKEEWIDLIRSFAIAIVLAVVFRSFFFEPFHIPSGSMHPTLIEGDYIFVSKYSYGYSRYSLPYGIPLISGRINGKVPDRGDIVVFKLPSNHAINYIKRLIGLPGDTIQVKGGVLYLNGVMVPRKRLEDYVTTERDGDVRRVRQYLETLPSGKSYHVLDDIPDGPVDNTEEYVVPEGHYFMMGDNRDHSQDSRVLEAVGYVPVENLVGPARVVFFSTDSSLFTVWRWFSGFKLNRFWLYPDRERDVHEAP